MDKVKEARKVNRRRQKAKQELDEELSKLTPKRDRSP